MIEQPVQIPVQYKANNIWDQKENFWNNPSGADIYSYNKINPVLLTALCLLLTLCWACMLGVNTNVSVI